MKKVSLSICIPAYNEEQNIENILLSLLAQKTKRTSIKEITIYSDASTDRTNEITEKFGKKNKLIRLYKGKTRKGKYARMNEMFVNCKTDILIIIDADIAMKGEMFLEELASVLISDPTAITVSAKNIFVKPKKFMAQVLQTYYTMWDNILLSMPYVESAAQFSGTATAFRGEYARRLRIPARVTNPHLFLYLAAKKINGFRYCKKAEVLQYAPATMNEVRTILGRAIVKPDDVLDEMFGKEMIRNVQYVPRKTKMKVILRSLRQNPFYTPFAILMTLYITRLGTRTKRSSSQLWDINTSTKRTIAYAK